MSSDTKNHDYHIIDPSPWPFIGSMSALVMAIGAITWMRDESALIFGVGLIGVLYTMFAWWRDVVREANTGHHTRVVQLHHRYGMIMFIASEVMFFVAWFWAFFDASLYTGEAIQETRAAFTGGVWPPKGVETFSPWGLPLLNTVILLTSGTTLTWAHHALVHGDRKGTAQGLLLTIALGAIFTVLQVYEYMHAGFGFSENIYGAVFYMATGFHGAHVVIGTIFLLVCYIRLVRGDFTPEHHFGFEAAAWYWHFVDVVWLFLFVCVYIWGG